MQSSDVAHLRYGSADAPVAEVEAFSDGPKLAVNAITLTSAVTVPDVTRNTARPQPTRLAAPSAPDSPIAEAPVPSQDCSIEMAATAAPLAQVDVVLTAPCLPYERVTLHHSGMMITQTMNAKGKLRVSLPALAEKAVVIAAFSNGDGAMALTSVPDLAGLDRVVLQWKGISGFEMHAREFGADYGSDRHIWHGAPGKQASAIKGESGYMVRLGDASAPDALMAEIYTYPTSASTRKGVVDLSVEAEVSLYNCGMEVEAQSLELRAGTIRAQDLTLAISDCDTIGSFLVLNNLVQDLKIAAR